MCLTCRGGPPELVDTPAHTTCTRAKERSGSGGNGEGCGEGAAAGVHLVGALVLRDLLADYEHVAVALHLVPNRRVECITHGHLRTTRRRLEARRRGTRVCTACVRRTSVATGALLINLSMPSRGTRLLADLSMATERIATAPSLSPVDCTALHNQNNQPP